MINSKWRYDWMTAITWVITGTKLSHRHWTTLNVTRMTCHSLINEKLWSWTNSCGLRGIKRLLLLENNQLQRRYGNCCCITPPTRCWCISCYSMPSCFLPDFYNTVYAIRVLLWGKAVTYLPLFLDMFSVQQLLLAKCEERRKNRYKVRAWANKTKQKQIQHTHICKGGVFLCGLTRDFDRTLV